MTRKDTEEVKDFLATVAGFSLLILFIIAIVAATWYVGVYFGFLAGVAAGALTTYIISATLHYTAKQQLRKFDENTSDRRRQDS